MASFVLEAPIPGGGLEAFDLVRAGSHGSPNSLALRPFPSRCSGNPQTPQSLGSPHAFWDLCGSSSSMNRADSAFASRELSSSHLKIPRYLTFRTSVTQGDLELHDATVSRRKVEQAYRTAIKPLLKHRKHKPQADIRTAPIRSLKKHLNL